jgi:hypothetical protein
MTAGGGIPAGLAPYEAALHLRAWVSSAVDYSEARKARFRILSSATKVLSLVLSGASTIILGLQDLNFWAGLAFSLVALTTVVGGVEPFFNWRSRWVLAEEAQHRFRTLREDLEHLVAVTQPQSLTLQSLEPLYSRYREVWDDFSRRWLEYRRGSGTGGTT